MQYTQVQLDEFGRCSMCHLALDAIHHVEVLIEMGKATPVCTYPCGHSSIYRSLGVWTALVANPNPQLPKPPPDLFVASMRP